jgi:hypothetical protein
MRMKDERVPDKELEGYIDRRRSVEGPEEGG